MPIETMPVENAKGPGRDPDFPFDQYFAEYDIGGVTYRTAIFDNRAEGPVLLFIHGLAGSLSHFIHVAPAFAETHRVIGIDLLGCGQSSCRDERYDLALYVEQVHGLLDCLQIPRATLVGHSLGGMVSTAFALEHPDRIERVVLINPAGFRPMPLVLRGLGQGLLRPRLLNAVLPKAWELLLANVFFVDNAYTQRFIHVQRTTYDPVTDIGQISRVIADLRYDYLHKNFLKMLSQITVPMGVIWGSQDRLVPARHFRKAASRLPNALLCELQDVGHMPIIEVPEEVVDFMRRVLAEGALAQVA